MADIPGLIEGAHSGLGLGIKFLKHIERCKSILHLIDITSDDFLNSYKKVRKELKEYSPKLLKKNEIVVLNKIDLLEENEIKSKIIEISKKVKKKVYTISALKKNGITNLKKILISNVHN